MKRYICWTCIRNEDSPESEWVHRWEDNYQNRLCPMYCNYARRVRKEHRRRFFEHLTYSLRLSK